MQDWQNILVLGWHANNIMLCVEDAWRACTEVTVTVFKMSATVQPRDRSLTGRVRPCSTGPIAMAPVLCCTACMHWHAIQYMCTRRHCT